MWNVSSVTWSYDHMKRTGKNYDGCKEWNGDDKPYDWYKVVKDVKEVLKFFEFSGKLKIKFCNIRSHIKCILWYAVNIFASSTNHIKNYVVY